MSFIDCDSYVQFLVFDYSNCSLKALLIEISPKINLCDFARYRNEKRKAIPQVNIFQNCPLCVTPLLFSLLLYNIYIIYILYRISVILLPSTISNLSQCFRAFPDQSFYGLGLGHYPHDCYDGNIYTRSVTNVKS